LVPQTLHIENLRLGINAGESTKACRGNSPSSVANHRVATIMPLLFEARIIKVLRERKDGISPKVQNDSALEGMRSTKTCNRLAEVVEGNEHRCSLDTSFVDRDGEVGQPRRYL
jgi:hypothetical protein